MWHRGGFVAAVRPTKRNDSGFTEQLGRTHQMECAAPSPVVRQGAKQKKAISSQINEESACRWCTSTSPCPCYTQVRGGKRSARASSGKTNLWAFEEEEKKKRENLGATFSPPVRVVFSCRSLFNCQTGNRINTERGQRWPTAQPMMMMMK